MLYNVKLDAEELFMVEFRFPLLKIKMKGGNLSIQGVGETLAGTVLLKKFKVICWWSLRYAVSYTLYSYTLSPGEHLVGFELETLNCHCHASTH